MPKVSINPNSLSSLAREISAYFLQSHGNCDVQSILPDLAAVVCRDVYPGLGTADCGNLPQALINKIITAQDKFVEYQRTNLSRQGLKRFSDNGLRAFFFSSLYEALRFEGQTVPDLKRRKRTKRGDAAYFTPPSLAYLAAQRALSAYFNADTTRHLQRPVPRIIDPAMGTALYLVAALDYLAVQFPSYTRGQIADQCLFGGDIDATTCSVATICLNIACGQDLSQGLGNLLQQDSIAHRQESKYDLVLSNPPWEIMKSCNDAQAIATLRQGLIYQGEGDTSYYKIFLELSYLLLKPGGIAAILTPASVCGDKGAAPLRRLLLDQATILSLDGFVNEDCAFPIHQYFKFVLLCFKKEQTTESFDASFGLVAGRSCFANVSESEETSLASSFSYANQTTKILGGSARAILELDGPGDVQILSAIYQSFPTLQKFLSSEKIFFRREFDMTLDRKRFISAKDLEPDVNSRPLIEGSMLGQYQWQKGDSSARYYISDSDYRKRVARPCAKLGFVSITSAVNTRSMIAAYLPDLPTGNSVPTLVFGGALKQALYTVAIFNSFVFDWLVRMRLSGNNLSYHLLEDLPLPAPQSVEPEIYELCVTLSAMLSFDSGEFARERELLSGDLLLSVAGRAKLCQEERQRMRTMLEILVLRIYGLSPLFAAHILRHCSLPSEVLARRRRLSPGKGEASTLTSSHVTPDQRSFFRVDKTLPPEQRLPNMVLSHYSRLIRSSDWPAEAVLRELKEGRRLRQL